MHIKHYKKERKEKNIYDTEIYIYELGLEISQ